MSEFKTLEANGITHRVAVEGEGPLVLFVHGFPESWYSWRHQLSALAAAGYTAAACDVRGYGGTDKPHAVEDYAMEAITADMAGIAKALSPDAPAVIVGHDWGAPIAWTSALLYPDVFRAVAGLSVPYTAPGPITNIELFRKLFTDRGLFFYMVYFQEEGPPEAELEADPAASIRKFYYSSSGEAPPNARPADRKVGSGVLDGLPEPDMPLPWLSEEDVAYYAGEFAASGFRGPLNRYRNTDRDHAFLTARDSHVIHQPSLFIAGDRDPVLAFYQDSPAAVMASVLPDLRGAHILEGCGHWVQQERAEDVNRLLIDWLAGL